jgi:hypothetical protein
MLAKCGFRLPDQKGYRIKITGIDGRLPKAARADWGVEMK